MSAVDLTAALAQAEPRLGDKEANLRKMRKFVEGTKADMYIFGELYLTGYMCRDLFPKLAEEVDGPSVREVSKIAHRSGTTIIFGMPEKDSDTGVLYNSSILVTSDGDVFCYRKLYPANFGPFQELEYFRPGSELVVANTHLGRIGLLICYDTFFPEVSKGLALRGAEILACISAGPSTSRPFFDKVIPARAIENACFFLYSNLVGTELNIVFEGGTQAVGPRGDERGRVPDFKEDALVCDIDLGDVKVARQFRPTVRDTRREVLELLARSHRAVKVSEDPRLDEEKKGRGRKGSSEST